MKPFVRAQAGAAEAVVTATVSSSDSVKSITLSSLPLTVHAAAAAVVVAAGADGCIFCGVSASHAHKIITKPLTTVSVLYIT